MYATVRRYEGTDRSELVRLSTMIDESLIPRLSALPGFGGYYLIDAGEGVITSTGLFDTAGQAHESTRVAARWIREQGLEAVFPNTPRIMAGEVIVQRQLTLAEPTR